MLPRRTDHGNRQQTADCVTASDAQRTRVVLNWHDEIVLDASLVALVSASTEEWPESELAEYDEYSDEQDGLGDCYPEELTDSEDQD